MDDFVSLTIEDNRWKDLELANLARKSFGAVFKHHGIDPSVWQVSVLACDDARIAELNASFRNKATPTNVLSWPEFDLSPASIADLPHAHGVDDSLGDIAIAYETCQKEAELAAIGLKEHVIHLLTHGCLHLLGYDHEDSDDAVVMENLEIQLLATLGVDNPYNTKADIG